MSTTTTSLLLVTGATAEARFQQTLTLGPDFTSIQQILQWLRDRARRNSSPVVIDYDAILVNVLNLVNELIFGPGYPAFPTSPIIVSSPPMIATIESWSDMEGILELASYSLYPDETLWSETDEYPGDISGGDS